MFKLTGPQRTFFWPQVHWEQVLDMARDHGWSPYGTDAPTDPRLSNWLTQEDVDNWLGSYRSLDNQRVIDDDALNLAYGLEQLLNNNPDAFPQLGNNGIWTCFLWKDSAYNRVTVSLSTGMKDKIRDFIAFCREGGFTIDRPTQEDYEKLRSA